MTGERCDDPEDPAAGTPEESPPVRRPGPHGAEARTTEEEEAIARAYRRAERATRKAFQEVRPRTIIAAEAVTSVDQEEEAPVKGGPLQTRACFIATAAYGDADAPEVVALRRFRDERLLSNRLGTAFVRLYYRWSPPLARLIARKPALRAAVRWTLRSVSVANRDDATPFVIGTCGDPSRQRCR